MSSSDSSPHCDDKRVLCRSSISRDLISNDANFIKYFADHIPVIVGYWDAALTCRFANKAYLDWFGKTSSEMIGISLRELLGDALFQENEPHIEAALKGKRQKFERMFNNKFTGQTVLILVEYYPDISDDGNVNGYFDRVTNISNVLNSEARLIADNTHDALLVTEATFSEDIAGHRILYVNPAMERQSGYTAPELIGKTPRILNAADQEYPEIKRVREAVRIKQAITVRVKNKKKCGETYWVEASIIPVINQYGIHTHWISIQRDMSDRISYEQQILNAIPANSAIVDGDGLIIEVNERWKGFCSRNGGDAGGYIGMNYLVGGETGTPELRQFLSDLRSVLNGTMTSAGYEYPCHDVNTRRWFRCKAAPLAKFGPEPPFCALVMHVDITQTKEAESAAVHAGNRLETTLNNLPDLVWQKDKNGVYTFCNRRFEEFIGRPAAEIIGRTDYELVDRDLATFFGDHDKRAIDAGRSMSNEEWITFAHDKRRALLETIKTPVYDHDGEVVGVLGIGHEITKIRMAEQAAHEASRSKSAFVSNMSHEIRTPLNAIMGFTYSLNRTATDAEQKDKLRKIEKSATHLLAILNDILDMSKIEAGKMRIESQGFSLHALMNTVMVQIACQGELKGLDVAFDVDREIPDMLCGDALRLSQCLINFGGNAVKFTSHGTITLRALMDGRIGEGLRLRFEVEDTGIGIEAEALSRLFAAFEQADESTTRQYGGSGLGLALTKQLARLMDGEVGVESTPGKGSRFWFTAVLQKATGASASGGEGTVASSATLPDFGTVRILAAEDVALNREILEDMLRTPD